MLRAPSRWSLLDAYSIQMPEVSRHFVSVGVSVSRLRLKCAKDHFLQLWRDAGLNLARRRRVFFQAIERTNASKRCLSGEHLVQENPNGIDIAARVAAFTS